MTRRNRQTRRNRTRHISLERLERKELLAADLSFMQQNPSEPLDVNDDQAVTALDALTLINEMNGRSAGRAQNVPEGQRRFFDVNDDGALSPLDVLHVINGVNHRGRGRDAGRPERPPPVDPPVDIPQVASIDGTGNNLENAKWGSTGQAFERIVDPAYSDGTTVPADESLVSARDVSNIVNASPGEVENAAGLSDLTWLFGQLIDHDITLTQEGDGEHYSIAVPEGDPFFDPFSTGEETIDLERSGYTEDESGVRQQVNAISSFIDGSVIYGSDQERSDALRTFEGGLLATSDGDLLPFNETGLDNAGGTSSSLFLAGDVRANENAGLTAMQTLWVREHNRLATEIAEQNPEMGDDEIYQRARRWVTAELQSITYNEFLPALLGEDALSDYRGYDASVNPNLSNEFSTAAYRFGHTMLSPELLRLNNDGSVVDDGNLALTDAFFNVGAVVDGGIESLLLGASVQTAQEVDPYLVDDVRNFLFGPPGSGGFDLAALNIQRGRDHGLASYNDTREGLGLERVDSFAEISSDPEVQARLEEAYGDVDSIEAWVGMLAEDHVAGSTLGVTAGTIIAEQFEALRDGDRFYYENVFSGRQRRQLDNTTLADVIERNTNIDFANEQNVFYAEDVQPRQFASAEGRPGRMSRPARTDQAIMDLDRERMFGN